MGADKTNNIMTLSSGVSQPLLADVQYFELYSSSALNRKLKNIVLPGFYCGFEPVPGTGLSVRITSENSEGKGAASVDVNNVQISVQQIEDVTVSVKAGATNIIVLEANFEHGVKTTQVDSTSSVSAARIYARTDNTIGQNQIELCRVIVPSGATAVTKEMIVLKYRVNRAVGVEFSNEISSTEERKAATPLAVKTLHDLVDTKAPLDSPHLSGTPTSPTPEPGTKNTQIANAAFVYAAINALINGAPGTMDTLKEIAAAINNDPKFSETINNALALKAPLASPVFTGTPTAPTASQGTNSTQIANTAFVKEAITALINGAPGTLDTLKEIAAAINNDPNFSTTINNALALKAPLASPALTGVPTAPTAAQGTNNTQIATTAYVRAAISALVGSSPEALDTLNELAAALGNDPNFATTMTNALAGKQPLDATLTALAGLATGANKLPYFTGKDTVAQTDLTSVGRDILAKTSTLAVIQYLGLRELGTSGEKIPLLSTANTWSAHQTFNGGITGALAGNADTATKLKTARTINGVGFDGSTDITLTPENLGLTDIVSQAGNAVQRSGDKMTGELKIGTVNALRIFNDAFGLIFRRSEDFLHFIPTAEGQGENGDIGPLRPFAINLRTGAISVSHGAKIEGGLAIGATDNALGENSIVLGDNDTGFRQDGDGIISFYSNGSRIGHIDGLGLYLYKDIESNGSNFRLKSNYRHHITFANEDGSIRMFLWKDNGGDGVHINNGSDGGGDFIFKRDGGFALGSGAQVASNGDIYGSVWENNWLSTWLHNHVVRDIRLGSIEHKNVWRDYGFGDASGYVLTAAINSNADDIVDTVARRPIQKLIGGIWYNVGSV
ncbi:tail fiber protein [Escherichia coli]|uniref:tail fiber protein n=1 Tax=Escherichia coli TaxID=562 RepID=UPI001F5B7F17|nr:tail fiber protein [Escherichia coli]MCI3096683.1 tail fiber protein [Escherichia coli]